MSETIPPPTESAADTIKDSTLVGGEIAPASTEAEAEAEAEETEPERSFDDFNLSEPVLRALEDVGYEAPMEVQSAVWEPVMAGRDIQVESRTGSGKTAAFGLPIIEKLSGDPPGVASLILAPTRELAKQVADELTRLAVHTDVGVAAVYGGAAMGPQVTALKAGVKIVAGTPGRVLDHIRRRNLDTSGIKVLVLDECDEMLSMGFAEEIENIIGTLPPREERQTLLFSATIPDDIMRIAQRHMTDPVHVRLSQDGIGAAEIDHSYYLVNGMARTRDLLKVVLRENPESAIIFCNTRDDTAVVARHLAKNGFDAEAISGELSQGERERVMNRARAQNLRFLVATDIAARGIDISNLSHVINYQFPESAEVYVHRTGRTGRAGKKGTALSLVGPREIGSFYYLKLIYKIRPTERDLPPTEELKEMLEKHQIDRVTKLVTEKPNEKFVSLAQRLWQSEGGEQIVGALLERLLVAKTSVERDRNEKRERERTEDRERRPRRSRSDRDDRDRGRDDERDGRRGRRSKRTEGDQADGAKADGAGDSSRSDSSKADDSDKTGDKTELASDKTELASARDGAEDGASETTEARTSGEAGDEARADGEPRKKRRRRRRRGGRDRGERSESSGESSGESSRESSRESSGQSAKTSDGGGDGDGREFWETWADEKSDDGDAPSDDAPRSKPRGEGEASSRSTEGESKAKADEPAEDKDGTARLYVNIGKREDATSDDIRDLIGGLIGDDGAGEIASIALRNTHSYVRVPDELVDGIIKAAEGQAFRERDLLIERARR